MSASTPTDWEKLLPTDVSTRVIESAIQQSVVLRLAERRPMPRRAEAIPVVSTAPSADWIAAGARKPITKVEWSAEMLEAEEIAAVTSVPDVYIDDTTGRWVEDSVEAELAKTIGRALDAAVLFGTNAPSSFPAGGIAAIAGTAQTGADALAAIDAALTQLEGEGLTPDGIASSVAIGAALREAYRQDQALPAAAPASQLYGLPVSTTTPWPSTTADAFVGGWSNLVIGVRQDINYTISRDGVLVDDQGAIQVSAFQDDQTLIRVYARFGCVVGRPLKADGSGPSTPFVAAKWTS